MVAAAQHGETEAVPLEYDRRARLVAIGADAHRIGPRRLETLQGLEQRLRAVVECVVVRRRDAVDAKPDQNLRRARRRPKEERRRWIGPALAALGCSTRG
jgi:hypothetical protein